jgi:stearoyl-CoA desaturase (delta-9 desaturase)
VARANEAYTRLKRRLVFSVVVVPLLGSVAALALAWRYGVGPVEVGLLIVMYLLTILGISVGFHRHFTHRSFQTSRALRVVLIILGSMAVQGPILTWAAVHRRHHQYSDQLGDPHSPYLMPEGEPTGGGWRGFWHSHVGWLFAPEVTDWGRYVPDLMRDKTIFKLDRLYFLWLAAGFVVPALVGGLWHRTWLGALNGFLWGGMLRLFLVHHASWTIGSVCHIYGGRPFDTKDGSTNNAWLALVTVGDSWHNNHHAFPASAMHGLRWWEFDLAGWVIRTLAALGLVWNVERPTPQAIRTKLRRRS